MDKVVEIEKLFKKYKSGTDDLVILEGLDLTLEKGKKLIITGESGCGKSTLLNIMGGLDRGSGGVVKICGADVEQMEEKDLYNFRNRIIGFVFQFHYLLKELTAAENVMMPMFISGETKKKSLEEAEKILLKVNLAERASFYPYQLSGGERQRVAVARALINNPSILLADEPTGNLDEKNSRIVEELLFSLVAEQNTTLVMVTHDASLSERGDMTMKLEKGRLREI
ncbi:MAG: ABC transporter ATP-binding protein [Spirochaetales bacterium]|nr:ABC transporter ATP-binding protein [Spirochaetales bacterium]